MPILLKKSAVRRRLLELSPTVTNPPGSVTLVPQYTRVSEETFVYLEEQLDLLLTTIIARQTGEGKTIRP